MAIEGKKSLGHVLLICGHKIFVDGHVLLICEASGERFMQSLQS